MSDIWYYARAGQQSGPVSFQQLREMAGNGQLLPSDHVFQQGTANWALASSIPDLFPPQQPPPPMQGGQYQGGPPNPGQPAPGQFQQGPQQHYQQPYPGPPIRKKGKYSNQELYEIGKNQKRLLAIIGISILFMIFFFSLTGLFSPNANNRQVQQAAGIGLSILYFGAVIVMGVLQLIALIGVGKALRLEPLWLWVISVLLPCIGLLMLLIINGKATSALQKAGIKVGFMGASSDDLEELLSGP